MHYWGQLVASEPNLQALCDEFEANEVWSVGTDVLGFPPTWCASVNDLLRVREALQNRKLKGT